MSPSTAVERRGRVAVLTLGRPDAGNRITTQMALEVASAFESMRDDPAVGACLVTGQGDAFCLGGDFHGEGATPESRSMYADALTAMDRAMCGFGKPLVAAVNGDAHAGGFALVVACDLAVMAEHATLGLPEAARGLFPFIATAIVRDALPKKVFFDLVYNARLMAAAEARSLRLVNEIAPRGAVLDVALAAAERASAHDPAIVRLGRSLYYDTRNAGPDEAFERARIALDAALERYAAAAAKRLD
ncbi:MAG TPA: enoyl-CoA hydratase/isomerase family protein [Burkholderiales bacterium]|nr:enoyl-CoA hydratase/isomerase family protein [Burkholderiales bacterium]